MRLQWNPEIYGTWLYWIIVYDFNSGQYVSTQGPLGDSVWHYVPYGSPDFNNGSTELTLPSGGLYWVFLFAMGWDGQSWSELGMAYLGVP